jgi:predicted RNA-binding Zn ribbon-like protein
VRPYEVYPGQPGGRALAPGALAIVQAFINTVDREHGIDGLARPAHLDAFLADHGLAAAGVAASVDDLAFAIAVREALRDLISIPAGGVDPRPAATATLEQLAPPFSLRYADGGRPALVPAVDGTRGAVGRLLAILYDASVVGQLERFKACSRDVCRWAFYDRSKNASSTWCAMAVCGNRTKTRRYRSRRGAAAAD